MLKSPPISLNFFVFRGASNVTVESFYGEGGLLSSQIFLDDVQCSGQESNLLACDYVYPSNCHAGELAGVICKPNTGGYRWYIIAEGLLRLSHCKIYCWGKKSYYGIQDKMVHFSQGFLHLNKV